jgi:hypothetical protein
VQNAFLVFQRFYQIHQNNGKPKTYEDFCKSAYYNAFVKFGRYIMHVNPLYPEKYIDYIIKSRIKLDHSDHDRTHGCDIRLIDQDLLNVANNTKVMGIMQGEDYFWDYREEVKECIKVKPEFDNCTFSSDDICILNIIGHTYFTNN